MLLRGRKAELITTAGEALLDRDDDFWIVSDDRGEMWGACTVILCKCRRDPRPVRVACKQRDIDDAESYHERKMKRAWKPQFCLGPWRYLALASEIRYLRSTPPPYRHPFEHPVKVYVSTSSPVTYKVVLGRGCILNDHGFVEP